MPRHPKPAPLRANRERLDVGILGRAGRAAVSPMPPEDLLPMVRQAWLDYWSSPVSQLVTTGTDLMALRRLFRYYDENERAMVAYRRRRTVKGSMGQRRLNPVLGAVAAGDILALEDRFGLSPLARLHLGIILGDAARSLADLDAELGLAEDDQDVPDPRLIAMDRRGG